MPRRLLLALSAMAVPGDFISEGVAAVGTSPTSLTAAPDTDAALLDILAELRCAEAAHTADCIATDGDDVDAETVVIEDLVERMIATPAASMTGIAVKAARLVYSLHPRRGGLMYCEDALPESLAADLARLAPEVVA
jgi:hypothetical protein